MTGVAIVDSGANYASVCGALRRLNAAFELTHDAGVLRRASHVILPGVGNVGDTWARLQRFDLIDTLRSLTQPVLGICVGMQIMFEHCDEAGIDTLGLFEGRVRRLAPAPGRRVPHCGWNRIELARATPLTRAMPEAASDYVYFVHSFAAGVGPQTVATADHGTRFAAAVARDNFHGVQFHPERSADPGRAWLAGFLRL